MSAQFGTARNTGAISTSNAAVIVIEFHARSTNQESAYVGDSGLSSTNEREITPGEPFTLNFSLPDVARHAGKVLLSSFYVQVSGGDQVDWTAIIRDPAA